MADLKFIKPLGVQNIINKFCFTIGMIPSSYKLSLTYEEQILAIGQYLEETVIPALNNNAEAVAELQTLFIQLKDYVENYFDDLNIQNEINNKLNDMAEDGTLAEIINENIFNELNTKINDNANNIEVNNTKIENNLSKINKINNDTKGLNLKFQNHIIHDIGSDGRIQGMCVDNNNRMYVYNITNNPYGRLLVYDIESMKLINEIPNLKLYHGNDMTYLNGKIYVATIYDEEDRYVNKKICIYDLNTQQLTEINPFENIPNMDNIWGISSYDEEHLICGLMKGSDNLWNNLGIYLLNINTYEITEITVTNTNNYNMSFYRYHQCIEYLDGKLYFALNAPNTILELTLENNVANVNKFYDVPNFDNLGLNLGEIEGFSKIPSGLYGKGTLIFNTEININQYYKYKTLKCYLFNPFANMPLLPKSYWYEQYETANYRSFIYLDNTKHDILYEDGTPNFPFKELGRALQFVSDNKITLVYSIVAKGNNYIIGAQSSKKARIYLEENSQITFMPTQIFLLDCDIEFMNYSIPGEPSDFVINFDYDFEIEKSNISFFRTTITGNQRIFAHYDSKLVLYDVNVNIPQNIVPFVVDHRASCYGGVKSFVNNNNKYFDISGFSILYLNSNLDNTKIQLSNTSSVIKPGIK